MDPAVLDRVLALGPAPADLVLVGQGDRVELMGLVAPVVLVPPRLVGRAGPVQLVLVGQGDRVELMGLVAPVVLVPPRLVGRAGPVQLDLARLVPPVAMAPEGRAVLARRVPPADRVGLMSLVDRAGLANRVELMSRVVPADPADPAVLGAPAVPDLTGRVDLAGRAAPVDRLRRRTSNTVSTTGVAPRWAAPETCPMGSARRITGHRLRPESMDSAGTVGLPPALRRLSGTDHRLQVDGAGLRLPVVGTAHGTGRHAMSQSRSVISGRLVTTGTTRSRCSTRYSVDGASGSSVSGSRCTDLTAPSRDYLSSSTH